MYMGHSTHYFFKSTCPNECLLACHCVEFWWNVFVRIIEIFAFCIGISNFEIRRLSMWHILTQAKQIDEIAWRILPSDSISFNPLNLRYNHKIDTRKACVGYSDLEQNLKQKLMVEEKLFTIFQFMKLLNYNTAFRMMPTKPDK